jgi:hypothetical protein
LDASWRQVGYTPSRSNGIAVGSTRCERTLVRRPHGAVRRPAFSLPIARYAAGADARVLGDREKSVLIDRMDWARSYSKLGGAFESPRRGCSSWACSVTSSSVSRRSRRWSESTRWTGRSATGARPLPSIPRLRSQGRRRQGVETAKEFGPPCLVFFAPVVLLDSGGNALLVSERRSRSNPVQAVGPQQVDDELLPPTRVSSITSVLSSRVAYRRSATSLTRPSRVTSSRSCNETPSRREWSAPCW